MGIYGFLAYIPMLLFSLFIGVIVDRLPRRSVLIATNLGHAVFLSSIPIGALFHVLSMIYLDILVLITGTLAVFFEVAYQSYLPSLIPQEQVINGNGKLEASHSFAQIVGPGAAGFLVQLLSAPLTIFIDVASFIISACFLGQIKEIEQEKKREKPTQSTIKQIKEGLGFVFRNHALWPIAAYNSTINLFGSAVLSIIAIYILRELKVAPVTYGIIIAIGSSGALLGSLFVGRIIRHFGTGRTIFLAAFIYGIGALPLPLAFGPHIIVILMLTISLFTQSMMLIIFNITQVSFRQTITPPHLLGRMNASMRFLICSTLPIGSLLGGSIGESIGLRSTIAMGAVGMALASFLLFFSVNAKNK
jgi:MFS family permease